MEEGLAEKKQTEDLSLAGVSVKHLRHLNSAWHGEDPLCRLPLCPRIWVFSLQVGPWAPEEPHGDLRSSSSPPLLPSVLCCVGSHVVASKRGEPTQDPCRGNEGGNEEGPGIRGKSID